MGRAAPRLGRLRRRGLLGRHPARRHPGRLQDPRRLLVWENTALIRFQGGHPARGHRAAAVHPAQDRPARAHQAARHRLPRLHPPRHRQPARRPYRACPAHRGHGAEAGTGDFVAEVASELPLQAISDLLGVPQEDRGKIFAWSNRMIGDDERVADDDDGGRGHRDLGTAWPWPRNGGPAPDDIVTKLISAEIDGHQLSDDEFGFFVLMLAVAGNETTRNAIAHGMLAFLDTPISGSCSRPRGRRPQRTRSSAGPPRSRVPAHRHPGHQPRRAGDQGGPAGRLVLPVGQLRRGGVRQPERFDIVRDPNPHLGYGGTARTTAWAPTWPSWRSS